MTEMTPHQLAAIDQWLASIHEMIRVPVEAARHRVLDATDPAKAYIELCREMRPLVEASDDYRTHLVMSYVAALYVLARQGDQ
jgi:hypothetical protein